MTDPTGIDEAEALQRAREAAIWSLDRSATMNAGASEGWRVAIRLGHRDYEDSAVGAVMQFWRDLARPLAEIVPEPSSNLLMAREMAARHAEQGKYSSEGAGASNASAFRSGLRDHFNEVKHRLEGMEYAQGMSAGTAETLAAQGEARQPGPKDAPEGHHDTPNT